jgi:hypothetical protein
MKKRTTFIQKYRTPILILLVIIMAYLLSSVFYYIGAIHGSVSMMASFAGVQNKLHVCSSMGGEITDDLCWLDSEKEYCYKYYGTVLCFDEKLSLYERMYYYVIMGSGMNGYSKPVFVD